MVFATSAVAAAVVADIGFQAYSAHESQKKQAQAAEDARKQSEKDAQEQRKSEVFAETEGQGVGSLGEISLAVDKDVDEDDDISKQNVSSNISV